MNESDTMWETIKQQFEFMSTRTTAGDATAELVIILVVSFVLGFLFCYVPSKSKD